MIEIYLLEQLVAFARHGTLLRAAEELHITQPALSHSMKKIEEQLGVQIFDRQNSKISLNETGRLAADYAARVMQADREMIERVTAFDRSQRTISIGSCAPFPLQEIIPVLQDNMIGMAITSEIIDEDERLITGLKKRTCQLVILHEKAEHDDIFCQRYIDEKLYVTLPKAHSLAERASVSFDDLKDTRILVSAGVGFWMNVCREKMPEDNLLIQKNHDAMGVLIEASSLPFFNSDRMMERGYMPPDRIAVPISDSQAKATYYIACMSEDKRKYSSLFNAVRGNIIKGN
mgnify:CR=1 FL=1